MRREERAKAVIKIIEEEEIKVWEKYFDEVENLESEEVKRGWEIRTEDEKGSKRRTGVVVKYWKCLRKVETDFLMIFPVLFIVSYGNSSICELLCLVLEIRESQILISFAKLVCRNFNYQKLTTKNCQDKGLSLFLPNYLSSIFSVISKFIFYGRVSCSVCF